MSAPDLMSGTTPGTGITDPWHSRSFKSHRSVRHPDWPYLLGEVWEDCCWDLDPPGRRGSTPATPGVAQLGSLLTDLHLAFQHDPTLSIGIPLSRNHWITSSRYNPVPLTRMLPPIVHRLHEAGWVDLAAASYASPDARGNRTTRIRPTQRLRDRFSQIELRDEHIVELPRECIVLKDEDGRPIEYHDTPETIAMRASLRAYNHLISVNEITLDGLVEPWITRTRSNGQVIRVPIDRHHRSSHRIFSRGRWDCNGRFHGPWWQSIGKELRSRILINGRRTVEVDFKSLHPALLAAQQGLDLTGDLYHLPRGAIPWAEPDEQRRLTKQLLLMTLNARTRRDAYASFRKNQLRGTRPKAMRNTELEALLNRFIGEYPWIDPFLGADMGIRLMDIDAQIAERVIDRFTRQSIPVLCIHDSFIVTADLTDELIDTMPGASEAVVGRKIRVEVSR